jgi:hypothetical protein
MVALLIQAFEHLSIYLQVDQRVLQILQGHVLSNLKLIFWAHNATLFNVSHNIYHKSSLTGPLYFNSMRSRMLFYIFQ